MRLDGDGNGKSKVGEGPLNVDGNFVPLNCLFGLL